MQIDLGLDLSRKRQPLKIQWQFPPKIAVGIRVSIGVLVFGILAVKVGAYERNVSDGETSESPSQSVRGFHKVFAASLTEVLTQTTRPEFSDDKMPEVRKILEEFFNSTRSYTFSSAPILLRVGRQGLKINPSAFLCASPHERSAVILHESLHLTRHQTASREVGRKIVSALPTKLGDILLNPRHRESFKQYVALQIQREIEAYEYGIRLRKKLCTGESGTLPVYFVNLAKSAKTQKEKDSYRIMSLWVSDSGDFLKDRARVDLALWNPTFTNSVIILLLEVFKVEMQPSYPSRFNISNLPWISQDELFSTWLNQWVTQSTYFEVVLSATSLREAPTSD